MAIQNPQIIDIKSASLDGYLRSGNVPIPPTSDTDYLMGSAYLPSASPIPMRAYLPDLRSKYVVQNFNNAYPGLEWQQNFEVIGGKGPILYEIVQGHPGMTMVGKFTRDPVTGYLYPSSDYAVLRWQNPVAGRYTIVIRATDQTGQMVYWIYDLFVGTANHFFMALVATGTGLGTSPSNCASYDNTFVGSSTLSPSQGKVLHIKGSTYESTVERTFSTQFMSSSWVAIPGENPILRSKIKSNGDNWHFQGLTFQGAATGTGGFGILGAEVGLNNFSVIGCLFDECINNTGGSNNQACIGFTRSGPEAGRETIVVLGCEFKNSTDLHGFDYYRIKDNKFARNKLTVTNGTSAITRSWIFPKQEVYTSEIEYNTANIPSVIGSTVGVAQLYNSVVGGSPNSVPMLIDFKYNYINVGGGLALQLQQDEGTTSNLVNFDNYVTRNTIVGGRSQVAHWVSDGRPNRRNFLESNIIVNSDNGQTVRDPGFLPVTPNTTDWFYESGTNLKGTSGIVDGSGLLPSGHSDRGETGHGIWKPA